VTRVGYVIWSLGLGGAEQVVIRLAAALDRARFTPVVFCLDRPREFAEQARRAGVEVVALDKRGPLDLRVLPHLVRLIDRHRIDLLHTHLWGANLWGRLAACLAGVPVVATEHNVDVWKRPYHLVLDRLLEPWTRELVAVSPQVRDFYQEQAVGEGRWRVIHNGIDLGPEPAGRRRGDAYRGLGIGGGDRVVGLVGRLVAAKAPAVFLEAMARVARVEPRLRPLVIGDGPLRVEAEERAAHLGLGGRAVFAGLRQDVPELLSGMDVLVFSSTREGLSIAMLEAMAAGVPVVATRVGGTPELIESGVSGFLVEAGDAAALAERVLALLADPALAERTRQAARTRVRERFSLAAMVRAHEALYLAAGGRAVAAAEPPLDRGRSSP
jgi:glycosyltransferase involved in cell wall biosynthesis